MIPELSYNSSLADLPDCDISYKKNFIDSVKADLLYDHLANNVPWQQDSIKVYAKTYPQPRLTALYGNNGRSYSYSNISMQPLPFDEILEDLKIKIEEAAQTFFTTCLLNLYRDGSDSNGWHADNETELGKNPVIASVSLGQERYFQMKHRTLKDQKFKILLEHGSLLLMQGATQHFWLHQLPKTKKALKPRINLTFRYIK